MNAMPTVGDMMAAYAEDAVDYCNEKFSVVLDYSEESIEKVEAVLASLHDQIPRGFIARLFKYSPPPQVIDQVSKMLGGYVGEVMRRSWGGHWKHESKAFPGMKVYTLELPGQGDVWPHFKVGKRIVNGPEDNVWHYFQLLRPEHSGKTAKA